MGVISQQLCLSAQWARLRAILTLSVALTATTAAALTEGELAGAGGQAVLQHFETAGTSSAITAADGTRLHYRTFPGKVGAPGSGTALVILPGRTESGFRYAEVAYDLRDLGTTIYVLDVRGQGLSDRLVQNRDLGYVRDFHDYVTDTQAFMGQVVKPGGYRRRLGFGHSLGGAIWAWALSEQPGLVDQAILSAPMLGIPSQPMPTHWLARLVLNLGCWTGFGEFYLPGHEPYRPDEAYRGTTSQARYSFFNGWRAAHPEEVVGGASFRWGREAVVATQHIQGLAATVTTPLLLLQAEGEQVVENSAQDEFCQRAPQCRKQVIAQALHELHLGADSTRDRWLAAIRAAILGTP